MKPFTFFISYRRDDTAPVALLLKAELERRLQFTRVYVDVIEHEPGDAFPNRIREEIASANATIALIGRRWMRRNDVEDAASTGDSLDWVEEELVTAHERVLAGSEASGDDAHVVIPLFVDVEPRFSQFALSERLAFLSDLHAESLTYANWPRAIGPTIRAIGGRCGLIERPNTDEYPEPNPAKARTSPVPVEEIQKVLEYDDYAGWHIDSFGDADARYLTKVFRFKNFARAAKFMTMVSEHCEVLQHHPEWRNVYRQVTVSLTTWDARRQITIYDLNLALFMNRAADRIRGRSP